MKIIKEKLFIKLGIELKNKLDTGVILLVFEDTTYLRVSDNINDKLRRPIQFKLFDQL